MCFFISLVEPSAFLNWRFALSSLKALKMNGRIVKPNCLPMVLNEKTISSWNCSSNMQVPFSQGCT